MTEAEHDETARSPTSVVNAQGPWPFVTRLLLQDSTGARVVSASRRNRKGLDPIPAHAAERSRPRQAMPLEPRRVTWWIAVLFMVGAALFGVGAAAGLLARDVPILGDNTFFVGSLFFSSAAYLQLLELINEPDPLTGERPHFAWWRWELHKIGWWEAVVQLGGTCLFNANTFAAMKSPSAAQELVWAPDAVGSVCFLVSSYLAYAEVCHRWFQFLPRHISWWIVVCNLLGSMAFGVSAVSSFVVTGGAMLNAFEANLWTLVGAAFFFVGAYLLLPEMTAKYAERSRVTTA